MTFDLGWKQSIRKRLAPPLTEPVATNLDIVAYSRMEGRVDGLQMQYENVGADHFLFVAHPWSGGISVLDVTDPAAAEVVAFIPAPNEHTWHIKVQVADGILMAACEGAFFTPGYDPARAEFGVRFYDVADPAAPKLLSTWTGGDFPSLGVHRSWWNGGRYAYLSNMVPSEGAGYHWRSGRTRVMTILDVSDPEAPAHVSDFWHPVQTGEGPPPLEGETFGVHQPIVSGDRAYVAYSDGGFAIVDVSDRSAPRLVSHVRTFPDLTDGQTHTCLPIPERDLLVVTEEPMATHGMEGPKNVRIWDISDETEPVAISVCPIPVPTDREPYETYFHKGERFGPHCVHENHVNTLYSTDRIYGTYMNAGLRIWDISDASAPRERASFVPPAPTEWRDPRPPVRIFDIVHGGVRGYCSQDVLVDPRGFIYLTGYNDGLWIVKEG
jgi:hypothetical protein